MYQFIFKRGCTLQPKLIKLYFNLLIKISINISNYSIKLLISLLIYIIYICYKQFHIILLLFIVIYYLLIIIFIILFISWFSISYTIYINIYYYIHFNYIGRKRFFQLLWLTIPNNLYKSYIFLNIIIK